MLLEVEDFMSIKFILSFFKDVSRAVEALGISFKALEFIFLRNFIIKFIYIYYIFYIFFK